MKVEVKEEEVSAIVENSFFKIFCELSFDCRYYYATARALLDYLIVARLENVSSEILFHCNL